MAIDTNPAVSNSSSAGGFPDSSAIGAQLINVAVVSVWMLFAIAVISGTKQFALWPQVTVLHDQGGTLAALHETRHAHFLRYLAVYPVFGLAETFGQTTTRIFSLVCLTSVLGTFLLLRSLDHTLTGSRSAWGQLYWTIAICSLASLMNGRIILAFLGYAMIVWAIATIATRRKLAWWLTIVIPGATLLCAVSSGVLVAALLFVVVSTALLILRAREVANHWNPVALALAAGLSVWGYWDYVAVGLLKNIEFFGGGLDGIWGALSHGAGRLLVFVDPLLLVPTLPIALGVYFLLAWASRSLPLPMVVCSAALFAGIAGGAFGISTLSISVVPLLAMTRSLLFVPARLTD